MVVVVVVWSGLPVAAAWAVDTDGTGGQCGPTPHVLLDLMRPDSWACVPVTATEGPSFPPCLSPELRTSRTVGGLGGLSTPSTLPAITADPAEVSAGASSEWSPMPPLTSVTEVAVRVDVAAELGEKARGAAEGTLSTSSCPLPSPWLGTDVLHDGADEADAGDVES